ncbi:hypothetical protein SAMN05216429_102159 [Marinobacter persicus]|uniref:UPF0319 protein SAMN05216429_102159 n=1 Tax=Marinobacter persicus TaxID=930118 RepID=A0A1I3QYN2_9GAMM|nr:DUF2057 domain-containing protein [Marinobacter persicus]SFJ38206.1 hypothetical protein SAMN05216429_102159 [Marinobacter persicus]
MKARFLPLCLSIGLFSSQALADVTLTLDSCLQAHALNGQEKELAAGESLTLANGTHQLVVDCTANLGRSEDDTFPETSDAFVLLFEARDAELTLSAPVINTETQMERFNRQGNFRLVSSDGAAVSYQTDVLKKEGFQVFRDYPEELEAFNRTDSPAALRPYAPGLPAAVSNGAGPATHAGDAGAPDQETVRQMLRYWYLQADRETRNEWKNWIESSQ